jgi:hypothetical protein
MRTARRSSSSGLASASPARVEAVDRARGAGCAYKSSSNLGEWSGENTQGALKYTRTVS